MTAPAAGFQRLLEALHGLRIPYMVGGSLATSIHGIPRSTNDIDLVVDLQPPQVEPLIAELRSEFYLGPKEAIEQALEAGRMFNLIHFASSYKFDFYPLRREPYHQAAFARRRLQPFGILEFYLCSPEDAILAKLAWYRAGQHVSEHQWSDVLDVVRVKRDLLDAPYLRRWGRTLGVEDLVEEALRVGGP